MSVLAGISSRLAPAVDTPRRASFREFLEQDGRVRLMTLHESGTYGPYTFKGRPALREVVNYIDHLLGSHTGVPLKDSTCTLAGGAQFGKTTLELHLAAFAAGMRYLNPIVYLPDDKLADDIVDAKFRPDLLDQIPWFAQMTRVGRAVNKSGKAVNTKGAFLVTNGKRTATGMFRGLQKPPTSFSADIVIEDEKDDIPPKNAKYLAGRMTNSGLRLRIKMGTQRIHGAGQNLEWKNGSQGVVLLGTAADRDRVEPALLTETDGHLHVLAVPAGFINPEEAWPQICRCAVTGRPRTDDPVLGYEGDFRRPDVDKNVVVATYTPDGDYYYAHPESGVPLDLERPLWHHRRPERLQVRDGSFRVAQIGTAALDLAQIVAHWTKAVGDNEEMTAFRCDRQALPKSAAQALTPEILARSRLTGGGFYLGEKRPGVPRFAGLDMGDRCWYLCRETLNAGNKRLVNAAQIAIGDVVGRVLNLCKADAVNTLFIDERPAVSEARTLALALNGLTEVTTWPKIDWNNREAHIALPGGLTWDGRNRKWLNLRCAVVRFTKNQLGAGIEQGGVEFQENGITKFVPVIACNRFETIDRVVREFLTPTESVVEVVQDSTGKNVVRTDPAMRLPLNTPGTPGIVAKIEEHFLAGSQREKDEKTKELGDYIDGIDNHLLFANGYSALAETIGGVARSAPFSFQSVSAAIADQASGHRATNEREILL